MVPGCAWQGPQRLTESVDNFVKNSGVMAREPAPNRAHDRTITFWAGKTSMKSKAFFVNTSFPQGYRAVGAKAASMCSTAPNAP
jgi:hypothetical protein